MAFGYGQWILAGGVKEEAESPRISWVFPVPRRWWSIELWKRVWRGRFLRQKTFNMVHALRSGLSFAHVDREAAEVVFTLRSPARVERIERAPPGFEYRITVDVPGLVFYGKSEEDAWQNVARLCEDGLH